MRNFSRQLRRRNIFCSYFVLFSIKPPILNVFFFYLFIYYNTITNYILIIYELTNFDHALGVVSQTRISGGNRTHDHSNSLAHYSLDYQGNHFVVNFKVFFVCWKIYACEDKFDFKNPRQKPYILAEPHLSLTQQSFILTW